MNYVLCYLFVLRATSLAIRCNFINMVHLLKKYKVAESNEFLEHHVTTLSSKAAARPKDYWSLFSTYSLNVEFYVFSAFAFEYKRREIGQI